MMAKVDCDLSSPIRHFISWFFIFYVLFSVFWFLFSWFRHRVSSPVFCLLSCVLCLVSCVLCLLSSVFCLLSSVFYLLPCVFYLLSFIFCLPIQIQVSEYISLHCLFFRPASLNIDRFNYRLTTHVHQIDDLPKRQPH